MIISVSGQHISIGSNLQEYSKERVNQVLTKYFSDIIKCRYTLFKRRNEF